MPTGNSSNEKLEEVYKNIDKLIENVKGKKNLKVMGDSNATVGKQKIKNLHYW